MSESGIENEITAPSRTDASKGLAILLFGGVPIVCVLIYLIIAWQVFGFREAPYPKIGVVAQSFMLLLASALCTIGFAIVLSIAPPLWHRSARWLHALSILLGLLCPLASLIAVSFLDALTTELELLYFFVPTLMAVAISMPTLFAALRLRVLEAMPQPPHCAACGYDLGHHPTAVCPECGRRSESN